MYQHYAIDILTGIQNEPLVILTELRDPRAQQECPHAFVGMLGRYIRCAKYGHTLRIETVFANFFDENRAFCIPESSGGNGRMHMPDGLYLAICRRGPRGVRQYTPFFIIPHGPQLTTNLYRHRMHQKLRAVSGVTKDHVTACALVIDTHIGGSRMMLLLCFYCIYKMQNIGSL